jgi:hypothetical protein
VLGFATLTVACQEDPVLSDEVGFCTGEDCTCPTEALPECDIRARSCQRQVAARLECVTGSRLELPDSETITQAEYEEQLIANGESMMTEAAASVQDAAIEVALKQLQLLDANQTAEQGARDYAKSFVWAYYSRETKMITVIDQANDAHPREMMGVFAHELVHAAQDQAGLLDAIAESHRGSFDASIAAKMAIEGEARLYQLLSQAAMLGQRPQDVGITQLVDFELKATRAEIATVTSPFWTARGALVYAVGAKALSGAWLTGGAKGVEEVLATSVPATLGWMQRTPRRELSEERLAMPAAPADFTPIFSTRMGAVLLYAYLVSNVDDADVLPIAPTWELAQSWRADTLALYDQGGRTALAWRVRFADRDAAQAFVDRAGLLQNATTVSCDELDVVLLGMDAIADVSPWRDSLQANDECLFPISADPIDVDVAPDDSTN